MGATAPSTGLHGSARAGCQDQSETALSYEELAAFVNDRISLKFTSALDMAIQLELAFERTAELTITIDEGVTLTVAQPFTPVNCTIVNNGTMVVECMYNSGLVTFINWGTVTIPEGGSFAPGQSDILNHGTFAVEAGGELLLERGTQFSNYAAMENSGYIRVDDGGAITDMEGSIANQGVMDIHSYFNGDISLITGEGTLNDKRDKGGKPWVEHTIRYRFTCETCKQDSGWQQYRFVEDVQEHDSPVAWAALAGTFGASDAMLSRAELAFAIKQARPRSSGGITGTSSTGRAPIAAKSSPGTRRRPCALLAAVLGRGAPGVPLADPRPHRHPDPVPHLRSL